MPDTGRTGTSDGETLRNVSLDLAAAADIESVTSFINCTDCLGPIRTPTLHTDHCIFTDLTDKDGADSKANGASSSSSSEYAEGQDNSDPIHKSLERQLSLDESGKERAEVIGGVTAAGGVAQTASAASSSSDPSSPLFKGKRKADDVDDSLPMLANKNQKVSTSPESPVIIFKDLPNQPGASSGIARCMETLLEVFLNGKEFFPGDEPVVIEPERLVHPPVTAHIPSATISNEGMLAASMDLCYIPDTEGVGWEGLAHDILLVEANGAQEPNFMHDDDEE